MGIAAPLTRRLTRQIVRSITDPSGGAASFSPASLFSGGEQGGWYDYSDMSTLFQNSGGTVPVTAVEQPIGLVLDKSKGLALGADVVVNGSFATDTVWTKSAGTVTISGGALNFTAAGAIANASQTILPTSGAYCEVTLVVSSVTSGSVGFQFDGGVGAEISITTPGTYVFRRAQAPGFFTFFVTAASAGTTAVVDSVSCKVISGNHLIQATSAARPVWSARKNLLTRTEDFANAAWSNSGVTLVANNATAPDGTLTASTITSTANDTAISQEGIPTGTLNGQSIIASIWMRAATPHVATIVTRDTPTATDSVAQNVSVTATWQRFDVPHAFTAAGATASLLIFPKEFGSGNPNLPVEIWHPQFERGSTPTRYQRVTTSTDYDTAGFPHFARYDGVDDSLNTAATVDFTATDKVGLWAGLTKSAGTGFQMLVELGTGAGNAFAITAPSSANNDYDFRLASQQGQTAGVYPPPSTGVISCAMDMAQATGPTEVRARVYGVDVATNSPGAATGNFISGTVHTGARAAGALLLNGQINQLIILGRTPAAQEITDTEAYITAKTVNV